MAYPTPRKTRWRVQVEFLDGTVISGVDDADVIERWHRLSWAANEPTITEWMDRTLARARAFYGARLIGVDATTPARLILDALAAERCIEVRRR